MRLRLPVKQAACALCLLSLLAAAHGREAEVTVGSKAFTESVILGELLTQLLHHEGVKAHHNRDISGGTQVLWRALLAGDLDMYPEYTGTLVKDLLRDDSLGSEESLRARLAPLGLSMSRPLGFNNTYALGMRRAVAAQLQITRISDLAQRPELRLGFSHEFIDRQDCFPSLSRRYGLRQRHVAGLDHDIAYRAIAGGTIDVIDLYSTDAEIRYYDLVTLKDDLRHFPDYLAVVLYRKDVANKDGRALAALSRLEGRIHDEQMIDMNASAKLRKVPETQVAAAFLSREMGITQAVAGRSRIKEVLQRTREHLQLVALSLVVAVAVAVPLGVLAVQHAGFGQGLLGLLGVVQTIPSLALLVFMIPLFGIGSLPAVIALFLYSLLPIVRNTYTGLRDIAPGVRESAEALGLPGWARLRLIELPLAARSILAGIKTASVINVGTATLGALIGAGGYGQPILVGIRRDDLGLILEGAIPAAGLALLVQLLFEAAEGVLVPRGLRLR